MPITCYYYQAFLIYLIGGYKHALAVLMWIHRRSEDPAPTKVACYWKKIMFVKCRHSNMSKNLNTQKILKLK